MLSRSPGTPGIDKLVSNSSTVFLRLSLVAHRLATSHGPTLLIRVGAHQLREMIYITGGTLIYRKESMQTNQMHYRSHYYLETFWWLRIGNTKQHPP